MLRDVREVGFLKYWTVSNIPLFFLATPMLCIMMISSLSTWDVALLSSYRKKWDTQSMRARNGSGAGWLCNRRATQCMAIPQLVLAALAVTSYHVQIVTRLSSGYPLWYLWLASIILEDHKLDPSGGKSRFGKGLIRFIVLYALIQGGLFASFLPPA